MDVGLYRTAWVKGTRAEKYYGSVQSWAFVADDDRHPDRIERGLRRAVENLERKAKVLGGNAVVSLEIVADPWSALGARRGWRIRAAGTAAQLVPL